MASGQTLEQVLEQVAQDNALTSVTVGRMPCGDRVLWSATVHYDGFSARNLACQGTHSDVSIADALNDALRLAQADRIASIAAPDALPTFEREAA